MPDWPETEPCLTFRCCSYQALESAANGLGIQAHLMGAVHTIQATEPLVGPQHLPQVLADYKTVNLLQSLLEE